ncbi:MAG: hypothetical protein ACYS26_15700, partial [Planctomycetota bacterium]
MRTLLSTLLLTGLLAGSSATYARAQAQETYAHNWQPLNFGFNGSLIFTGGDGLGGGLTPSATTPSYAGTIRICYGIDAMQGGVHASGTTPVTWTMLAQGHSQFATQNEAGAVSLTATAYNAASGDACFTPVLAQTDPTTGRPLTRLSSTGFIFAGLTFGGAAPVPTFWFTYFELFNGLTGGPLEVENRVGTAPAGPFPGVNPLLGHLVLEIQGPVNAGPQNIQYYLATTDEVVGPYGGVTNGNNHMGEAVFGLGYTADITGAVAHSRLSSFSGGQLTTSATTGFGGLGADQWFGSIATAAPAIWSGNDPNGSGVLNTGGGGVDWAISSSVSTVQLRALDILSGAEVAGTPLDPAGGPPSSLTDTSILASQAFFLFSNTEAQGTFQAPCGWCDLGGTQPMEPGDLRVGAIQTLREGPQLMPVCFDSLTATFSGQASFSLGTPFRGAYDPSVDSAATGIAPSGLTWSTESFFLDGIGMDYPGSSQMPAALPIAPAPNPALSRVKLCVTAALMEASQDPNTGSMHLGVNEFTNV